MKKQKQKSVSVKELGEIAKQSKMPEVAPPDEARKDQLTGKTTMDRREATQAWFRTAKQVGTPDGFLGVNKLTIDAKEATDRQMLHKKKK